MHNLVSFAPVVSLAGMPECSRSADTLAWLLGGQADQVGSPWLPTADCNFGRSCYHSEQASPGGVIVDAAISIVNQSNTTAAGGNLAPLSSLSPLSFAPPPRV